MNHRAYVPPPPLSSFVELFWYFEGPTPTHEKERLLPTGTIELVVNLHDDRIRVYDRRNTSRFQSFRGSVICGAHSEFFVIDTAQQAFVIGVHFKPGGAFPFLKLPASELRDEVVSLETLWGAAAVTMRDRLIEAETPEAMFRILEESLLAEATRSPARRRAVSFALGEFEVLPLTRTVADIAGQIGLSQRRFIQLFSAEVGLTPKLFLRVRRFQEAIRLIAGGGGRLAWPELALACGYFDQAHFIHDFRAFSGLSPSAYLRHRTGHLNHVPLLD